MTETERYEFLHHPWTFYTEPFRIVGNTYFVGNKDVGSYLLKTEAGLVLIDTGYPTTVPLLFASLMSLDVKVQDIRHVLHTHGHYDHFGATSFIKAFSGCATYLGERDAVNFRKNKSLSLIQDAHSEFFDVFEPDVLLQGGERLVFGDTEIDVVATPGHCDGCMSFFFNQEEGGRTVRCGLFGGAGMNSMTRSFIEKYGNRDSPQEFLDSLKRLEKEHVDVMLGNHTRQGDMLGKHEKAARIGSQEPFIDDKEFPTFLALCKKRLYAEAWYPDGLSE